MTREVAAASPGLTAREAEVLALLQHRLTNNEIAEELFLSVRTVESHVSALLRKLGVEDRRALARVAGGVPVPVPARGAPRPALPSPLTRFVGRVRELDDLVEAVSAHRLVTATGPGGVGKTRLALAAAHRLLPDYRDGAAFVDLVRVVDPGMVDAAVADAVGVSEGAVDRWQTLLAALADREVLLVVDNCEHVLDGVRPCVERILTHCPGVRVLATSRIRLMLPFEHVVAVPGLSIEEAADAVAGRGPSDGDAVALFTARMVAAGAPEPASPEDRARLRAICRALDGMALAIELAAARVPAIGLDGLSNALGAHLPLLTVGRRAEDRHRSLAAAIDWSYRLLDDGERATLRAASVFASRFDAEALAAVTGRPLPETIVALGRLVDWNLVMMRRGPTTRYRVLETIRQYATAAADESDEGEHLRRAHLDWARAALELLLDRAARGQDGDVERWCQDVDAVLDDARAALRWAGTTEGRRPAAAALAELIAATTFQRGRPGEAQQRYEQAAQWAATAAERRRYLRLAAGAAASRNVGSDAVDLLERAAHVAEDPDESATDLAWAAMFPLRCAGILRRQVPADHVEEMLDRARATSAGGPVAEAAIAMAAGWAPGATARSRPQTEIALGLARTADPLLHSAVLDQLMALELQERDLQGALDAVRTRLDLMATLPVDALTAFEHYDAYHMGCRLNLAVGQLPEARRYADVIAELPFFREERHISLGHRVEVGLLAGDFDDVVAAGELVERDWARAGRPVAGNLAVGMYSVATAHRIRGDDRAYRHWLDVTRAILGRDVTYPFTDVAWMPTFDALALLDSGDAEGAVARLAADPDDPGRWSNPNLLIWVPWYAALWAEAAALAGLPDADDRLRRATQAARANPVALAVVERSDALLRGDRARLAGLAEFFAAASCSYQQDRTRQLAQLP